MSIKPLISICMIVKDEEKNIRRCLDTLKVLLNDSSSELIVVDTGSKDQTPEICREYTDRLYFHEWNGNFSEMRNISISYATGEWIFIIDADEELIEGQKILELLNSQTIHNTNTVQLTEKNILSFIDNRSVFHVTPRLFRNDGEFKYVGTVHNQPIYKHPILTTDILLIHYGYINEDSDLMEKKFKRTSELLIKELKKDPDNIYYRFQLARSFLMHNDYLQALLEIRKAFNSISKTRDESEKIKKYYIYGEYARIAFANKHYEEVIQVAQEGLELTPDYIDLYFYLGFAHFYSNRKDEALPYFDRYFSLYDTYHRNELDLSRFAAVELYTIDEESLHTASYNIASHHFNNENYELALTYIEKVSENQSKLHLHIKTLLKLRAFSKLVELYNRLITLQREKMFIGLLETELKEYSEDVKQSIAKDFINVEGIYSVLSKARINGNIDLSAINLEEDQGLLSEFPFIQLTAYLAMKSNALVQLFKKLTTDEILKICGYLYGEDNCKATLLNIAAQSARANDLQGNRIRAIVLKAILYSMESELSSREGYHRFFLPFIESGINYVKILYNQEILRLTFPLIDRKDHRFFVALFLSRESYDKNDERSGLKYVKDAAKLHPEFSEMLKIHIESITVQQQQKFIISDIQTIDRNSKMPNVMQGTIEIANQMALLTSGLRKLGVNARSLTYYPNYLKYKTDYLLDIQAFPDSKSIELLQRHMINKFDVFHFHFGTSLNPNNSDLLQLKKANKAVLMQYWGSEVRMLSIAKQINPYIQVKVSDEEQIKRRLEYLASLIDHCVVSDHELYQYVKGYHKQVHFIKQSIDLDSYTPDPNFVFRKHKPVVVHAPTSPEIKGTQYILKAVEDLKHHFDFEFILVQGKSHDEARKIYQQADIVLDELLCGSYGILAIESMAMGKPVITYINEHIRETYPAELPLVSANPLTVKEVLKNLLTDWDLRVQLGKQGRAYVEKHHDVKAIANQFLNLYQTILSDVGAELV